MTPYTCTLKTFSYKINKDNFGRKMFFDVEIPFPEFVEPEDLFGHMIAKENVPVPFHDEIKKAFSKFIACETQKFIDSIADSKVTKAFAEKDCALNGILELASLFKNGKPENFKNDVPSAIPFEQRFQAVIKKSSPAQLSRIVSAEAEMSDHMSSLVRARDFEMERLSKACESAMNTVSVEDAHNSEQQSYNLAMLNEKLRQIGTNYFNQIDALSESQRRSHRELIDQLFHNNNEIENLAENEIIVTPKKSQSSGILNIHKATSCDPQFTQLAKSNVLSARDESFTIYIGAQMKSMHNARILLCDRLSDACQAPSSSQPGNVDLDSRRLQMLMSLYRRNLTSVVLIVGRDPSYHIQNRTQFAKLCEKSAELHFNSLEAQLKQVEAEVRKCNTERQRLQSKNSPSAYDNTNQFVYDDAVLQPGDVYITCHSNLSSAQVVYHLVVDKQLQTQDISSRHACIGGLRNIIRLSSKCAVQSICLPLLLVEAMNESMTVSWCMSRAELIFKCIKGFLMEVSAGSSSSASGGSTPSSPVHYNINFALPSKISPGLFHQIVDLFSKIFHLVPSVSA